MRKQGHTPEGWTPVSKPARSIGVAVLLSLLLVGAGHFYAGNPARGLAWLFGGIVLSVVTVGIAAPFVYILAACDAASVAKAA